MSCSETEEVVVSRFTEKMYRNARTVTTGMVTGEPYEPVRHTWGEVHERARAVARVGVGARGAAVLEQVQGGNRALDYLVDRLAVEPRKAGDTTPIVLVGRVVETSGPGHRARAVDPGAR